jgi:hypothetical protein
MVDIHYHLACQREPSFPVKKFKKQPKILSGLYHAPFIDPFSQNNIPDIKKAQDETFSTINRRIVAQGSGCMD